MARHEQTGRSAFGRAGLAGALALALLAGCERLQQSQGAPPALGARAEVQGWIGPIPGSGRSEPDERPNPYEGDANALAEGRRYFVAMNCSGCHGGYGGGGMGPSLRDEVWIYGGGAGDIYDSIAQGRANGMPAWGPMLPGDLIWRITAYIQSMRTPHEPSPPR